MCHRLLRDARVPALLLRFDEDLAEATRVEGCPCGGALHVSDYARKARGLEGAIDPKLGRRLSFCCSEEGCRRRRTPPSVRFLGRRVYAGVVVVLVAAMAHGLSGQRAERICEEVGVSRWTLERWRRWWTESFVALRWWRGAKGQLSPAVTESELPRSLVDRFGIIETADPHRLVSLMVFLSPITGP